VRLARGDVALVGYGSLFSPLSIGRTLGREYGGPFVMGHVDGWRRTWNVAMPNRSFYFDADSQRVYPREILYLNVRRQPGSAMNCVVLAVREDDLAAIDKREWMYERTLVTDELRDVKIKGGEAVMYVGRPEYVVDGSTSPSDAAIRSSYVRTIESALDAMPYEVREEFEQTSDAIPEHLVVDDRLDPYRPNPWSSMTDRVPSTDWRITITDRFR
jgi:hypothetical protein